MRVAMPPFANYEHLNFVGCCRANPYESGARTDDEKRTTIMTNNVIHNDLGKAVKLFNRWQFQEAADAFTKLANEFEGPERTVFEGIAELSHGFFRIWNKGGEPNAMVEHIQGGWDLIQKTEVHVAGLDMKEFHDMLPMCLEEAVRWRRGDVALFNRDMIPRIEYVDAAEG